MTGHSQWLHSELKNWVTDDLISENQAAAIGDRYLQQGKSQSWGQLVLSALGAILVGLAVILFFAYNWQDMPKWSKLLVVFLGLAGAHGSAIWLARKPDANPILVEILHLLGSMLFGAGIWLVAQVYHIDEHYPNALLVWSLGALALAWAMPSLVQGLLAVALILTWSSFEVFDFHQANHLASLLVLIGVLPLAWLQQSRSLLFFGLAALAVLVGFSVFRLDDELLLSVFFLMGSSYFIAGLLAERRFFAESASVFRSLGLTILLPMLYLFSFPEMVDELLDLDLDNTGVRLYLAGIWSIATGGWVWLMATNFSKLDSFSKWHAGLLLISFVLVSLASIQVIFLDGWIGAIPFNLLFLGHASLMVLEGSRDLNWKSVSLGCFLFSVLVITRYLDLFDSLLMRSAGFLVLGVSLFLVSNFYAKGRKAVSEASA